MLPAFVKVSVVSLALASTVLGASVASASTGANQSAPSAPAAWSQAHGKMPFDRNPFRRRPNDLSPEQRKALEAALTSCDYGAWKTVVGDRPITQRITESNFGQFCEANKLMRERKIDEAIKIFKELGIKPPFGADRHGHPHHRGPKPGQPGLQPPAPDEQQ